MAAPAKYSKDAPFEDPAVRCDSCQTLLLVSDLRESGCCIKCGGRKVRNVFSFTPEERDTMLENGVDPIWLALFEETEAKGVLSGK